MSSDRRPKVAEVAARAGVSTATVDRVLNGRGGVAPYTVTRVEDALRDMVSTFRPARIETLLPCAVLLADDGSDVIRQLATSLGAAFAEAGGTAQVSFVDRLNPAVMASAIAAAVAQGSRTLIVQAVDTALVRQAIDNATSAGVDVVTVLTDVPGSRRLAYVGLDNWAAGRTAGALMGRFCRAPGTLALMWGGQLYRSHEERESGFRSVLRSERPDLRCLEVITGDDTPALARPLSANVIAREPDLVGIYCIGGGIGGVAEAVDAAGRRSSLVLLGHNCNADTRPHLVSGAIDAVIHQDMQRIAAETVSVLCDRALIAQRKAIRSEIITRENMI